MIFLTTKNTKTRETVRSTCRQFTDLFNWFKYRKGGRVSPRAASFSRVFVSFVVLLLLPISAHAARVIEAGAIPFTAFLSKADFDQRYPGKEVADLSALEPGWYVIYEHESLSYYFGPVLLESTGQDYLEQLTETVEGAVAQRPTIQDYRLELSYEPSQSNASSGSSGSGSSSTDPSGSAGSPQPPPPPSFWGFIRRLFGF